MYRIRYLTRDGEWQEITDNLSSDDLDTVETYLVNFLGYYPDAVDVEAV